MCIIVDANLAQRILPGPIEGAPTHADPFRSLRRDIFSGHLPLVYGGKLSNEYRLCGSAVRSLVAELLRSGRAFRISSEKVDAEATAIRKEGLLESDDEHILAIARITGARVVCTEDQLLRNDVGNRNLIAKPRGKIWSATAHTLLRRGGCRECDL